MLIEYLHLCLIKVLRVHTKKITIMETNTLIESYIHISTEICYRYLQHNRLFTILICAFEI